MRRIFGWFVHEQRTIGWIVKELNRQRVPKDHRSQKPDWRHPNVINLLRSPKYIGRWPWGQRQNVRNPLTGQVSQEERPEEDCQQWVRECPELRIVEDQVFDAAQERLDENERQCGMHRGPGGRLHGSDGRQGRRHLLSGIVQCGVCKRVLHVGGPHGKYLFCPGYRNGLCSCGTTLRRDRAERIILAAIGECILQHPKWRAAIYEENSAAWKRLNERRPNELQQLQTELAAVERRIRRLVDQVEESDQPDPEIKRRLAERRKEQAALSHKIKSLAAPTPARQTPPTIDWVDEQLKDLGDRLQGLSGNAAEALRQLLTGPIVVHEHRVGNEKRIILRGTMSIEVGSFTGAILGESSGSIEPSLSPPSVEQITLDFRERSLRDQQAEEAWVLYEAGQSNRSISEALRLNRSRVTLVLQHAAALRSLPTLDGRGRRAHQYDENTPAPYRRLAEEI